MRAYAPSGMPIIGTKEIVPGVACVRPDSFRKNGNGGVDFEYLGHTDVDWDSQTTVKIADKKVFIDADGLQWTEDSIVLRDE